MKRAAALTVLALVAACGGGGEDVDPEADADASEAAIEALVDELEDEGFVVDEDDEEEDDEDLEAQSDDCEELVETFNEGDELPEETASEESEQFTLDEFEADGSGGSLEVEGKVGFTEDADRLNELFDLVADDDFEDCIVDALEASFEEASEDEGFVIDDLEIDVVELDGIGEQAQGFEITGEISGPGLSEPLATSFGVLFARDGRMGAQVASSSVGDRPDVDLEDLLELLVDTANEAAS